MQEIKVRKGKEEEEKQKAMHVRTDIEQKKEQKKTSGQIRTKQLQPSDADHPKRKTQAKTTVLIGGTETRHDRQLTRYYA